MHPLLSGRRILIVDDNLANRTIAQMILDRHGAETAVANSDETVMPTLREFGSVDLIIMDLMLPNDVSGFDVADSIRQEDPYQNVPVVAVSAADPAVSIKTAREKGFVGFISKPINMDEFPRQIADVLGGEKVWFDWR